jgi:outer membrane autotransporter protein
LRGVKHKFGTLRRWRAALLASSALALASTLPATGPAAAQDATWLANPGSGDFYDANNWSPNSVPTSTATFGNSATTALTLGTAGTIGGWTFNAGASAYTFDVTANQIINGAGIVINGGSATINFNSGTNNYFEGSSTAGNATISLSGSGLIFRHTSTAGNAAITNSGVLQTADTGSLGNATITNDAYLYLQNSSSAGSATITNNQTIYFYYSSTAGTATITNNSSLNFTSDSSADSAHITNAAAAQFDIAHNSTLADATVINSGQMSFWGGAPGYVPTAGNATITNNNGGTLNFRDASTAGSAHITNNSGGGLSFYHASTAGSATITNNYGIGFYDTSTAGNAAITNNSGGTLGFNNASSAGSATITNSGNLAFGSTSTAGNATITNNNNLIFYGTAGSATITNNSGGNTSFRDSSDGGSARFINNAGSTFDISGLTASGTAAGSIEGAGSHRLGGKTLTVGGNNLSTTISGVIADGGGFGGTGGSLTKTGTGTLTLTGTNTYTGATTVNGGTLAVNSALTATSGITVNNGGALGGTGTVGNTTITSGGALAPGNSIGTLTVQGNLVLSTGAAYMVEVSPAAADRTNVTGTATLAGATVQAVALPGSFRAQTYTILNATGGFGGTQFAGVNTTGSFAPGARNPHLTYDANNVFLVLDPGTLQLPAGASGNQAGVAGGINTAVESGATPPAGFDALLNMVGAKLTNALSQISGQPATGGASAGSQMMNSFLTLLLNPFGGAPGSNPGTLGYARSFGAGDKPLSPEVANAYAAVTPKDALVSTGQRWGLWGQGYGGYNRTSGDAALGTSDTRAQSWGFAGGADYRVSADTMLGFALAGGSTNWNLSQGLGGGKGEVFQLGGYGSHSFGALYVSAALSYAWHDMSTDRTVTVAGTDKLMANFDAHSFGGRVETGYRIPTPWMAVTPYAALQAQKFRTPSYSESATSGANTFALTYDARSTTSTRTELGAWFDNLIALSSGNMLALRTRAAWAHDHSDNPALGAVFQTLPGSSFTVNGAKAVPNSALLSAGAELRLANSWSIDAKFDGEFASRSQTYAGTGTVRYEW